MTRKSPTFVACAAAAALALAAGTARATLPQPSGAAFDKGAVFTVAGYAGAETLTNFPVLVRVSTNAPAGFSYSDLHSPTNGDDLAFVGMDGAGLPFEIDTWDTNGTSLVWVRLPSMTNGTRFAMCWGSAASGKAVCAGNPFADHYGVWHMNEANAKDSTANHLDGTADASVVVLDAKLGKGAKFPSDANSSTGIRTTNTLNSAFSSAISFETWACPFVVNQERAFFGKEALATFKIKNGATWFTTPGKTDFSGVNAPLAANTWYHLVVTFVPGQSVKVYVNGQPAKTQNDDGQKTGFNNLNLSCPVIIGNNQWSGQYYKGVLDECRLLTRELSADWIAADYATQSDPAFLSVGEAEPYVEPPSPSASLSVQAVGFTNATIEVAVSGLGAGAVSADVVLEVFATDDFAAPLLSETYSTSAVGTHSFAIGGLATNATYHARTFVTNDLHVATVLGPVSFTTLAPAAPTLEASFQGPTGSSLAATVLVPSTGADSATIRLEASRDGFETIAAASAPVAAVPGQPTEVTVGGLDPLTAYDLRAVVRNDWGLETEAVLGRFATLPASGLAELYVDSLGSGDGSSPESALPTIREALDIAAAGYTIWVRGGEGRVYEITNGACALVIPPELEGLSIRGWDGTPLVAVADDYSWFAAERPVVSNEAAHVTLAGLRFEWTKNSLGQAISGQGTVGPNCHLVQTVAPFLTLSNCEFALSGDLPDGSYGKSGMGRNLFMCNAFDATNLLVEGCTFLDCRANGRNKDFTLFVVRNNARFVGNVFSNVMTVLTGIQLTGNRCTGPFSFVSNVVYRAGGEGHRGVFAAGYAGPSGRVEVTYNRFVNDDGEPYGSIFKKGREGFSNGPVFHHNTIVGFQEFIFADGLGYVSIQLDAGIFDNIFVLAAGATNIVENSPCQIQGYGAESIWKPTMFKAGSFYRSNALRTGAFNGGTAAALQIEGWTYDITAGLAIDDTFVLGGTTVPAGAAIPAPMPAFADTNKVFSANFYRPRASRLEGTFNYGKVGWTGEDGEYPEYIGALPPLYPASTMMILK